MIQSRVKLSIFLIIIFTCLTTFILSLTDIASISDSGNIEASPLNIQIFTPPIKAEEITTISNKNDMPKGNSSPHNQMVVMQRPNWRINKNLTAQLNKLKNASANGDIEASYILGMNFKYCLGSPIGDSALERRLEQAYEFSDGELAVNRITKKYEYCADIEQRQQNQFYSYLEVAAKNGSVAAQEVISKITPEYYMQIQGYGDLEREDFIMLRDHFIKQKAVFLESAAKNGSIKALIRLSSMSRLQKFGKNSYVNFFAFNQLILELTQDNKTYNKYSNIQQKLYSQLTSEEIDNSFTKSAEWLKIIKSNGSLYLN